MREWSGCAALRAGLLAGLREKMGRAGCGGVRGWAGGTGTGRGAREGGRAGLNTEKGGIKSFCLFSKLFSQQILNANSNQFEI